MSFEQAISYAIFLETRKPSRKYFQIWRSFWKTPRCFILIKSLFILNWIQVMYSRVRLFCSKNCATISNFGQKLTALPRVRKKNCVWLPSQQKGQIYSAASMVAEVPRYTCTHAVTSMQLQIPPCMAQVAGHPRMQSWPAQMRGTSATILAAILSHIM